MTDITYEDDASDDIVELARIYAVERHGDQTYGDGVPYETHLSAVVQVMRDFGWTNEKWLAAAWLHDVIEDTGTTKDEIAKEFGDLVANIVWAVTGNGLNRKQRNADIYDKILSAPEASILKVADRIANVEASINNDSKARMYIAEREEFFARVARFSPAAMRERLDAAYDALKV